MLVFTRATAAPKVEFTSTCLQAQACIYTLKLDQAKKLIAKELRINPDNRAADYLNTLRSMLLCITQEDDASYIVFDSIKDDCLTRLSDCDPIAGYRDFLKEEVYFYSSVVNGKRGNALSAANDVRHAYNLGQDVIKDFPSFTMAKKTLGLLQSGFGSLPNTYRKLVNFMGYTSDMDAGISYLNACINDKSTNSEFILMRKEAQFYLASVYLYLKNDKTTAWKVIDNITQDYPTNPLSAFARVNVADKCKFNEEVIRVVEQTPRESPYGSIPFLDFALGKAKLQRLDSDADIPLLRFVVTTKGSSYIKSCYQKLSWHALFFNDESTYYHYIAMTATKGNDQLEEDEQALKYAKSGITPDSILLKSRLLHDGGYYQRALEVIRPFKKVNFETSRERTEYFYRKARIYDALPDQKLAEAFYKATIAEGSELPQYYASFAALFLGELYEHQNNVELAREFFKKSMQFDANTEYKKSVEYKAKAGIDRLDNKS